MALALMGLLGGRPANQGQALPETAPGRTVRTASRSLLPLRPVQATAVARTLRSLGARGVSSLRSLFAPFMSPASRRTPCPAPERARARLYVFPLSPVAGRPVRVVAVSWRRYTLGRLDVRRQGGQALPLRSHRIAGGYPEAVVAEVHPHRPGWLRVRVASAASRNTTLACARIRVLPSPPQVPEQAPYDEVWPVRRQWDRWLEALYSAWVAHLFFVPPGGRGGWRPLHQLTRDPTRNFLHDALGWGEDAPGQIALAPDCGDLPYFLRAYFAFKLGLPFAYRRCTRGDALAGPVCPVSRDNLTHRFAATASPVARFNRFVRESVGWEVHSGTARTRPEDATADLYPVALTQRALRPGRVFVDPAGHVHVVSEVHLGTRRRVGVLFGVDAHPDRTISRKRFAPGTFVFDARVPTGGFKAFRPLVYEHERIRRLSNQELAHMGGDLSTEQAHISSSHAFYGKVERLLSPYPVSPRQVYRNKILALYEAALERVEAVQVGFAYVARTGFRPIPMPRGPAIFETSGPWEAYSTPARDLRLLMAIQDVLDFPQEVSRAPGRYRIPAGWSPARLRAALRAERTRLLRSLLLRYPRSDGSLWTLTLQDLVNRRERLRHAYHPNDCPEVRWGALPGSEEARPCTRRAPVATRQQMRRYDVWFALLKRPSPGG